MSLGVPCVSFDCPFGPSEIIRNQEDGLLVKNGDIQGFANALCHLIEHEAERKAFGKRAKQNIKRYSLRNIMPQWEMLFHKLTEKWPSFIYTQHYAPWEAQTGASSKKRTIWLTKCIRMYLLSQIHKRTTARFPDISQNQAHWHSDWFWQTVSSQPVSKRILLFYPDVPVQKEAGVLAENLEAGYRHQHIGPRIGFSDTTGRWKRKNRRIPYS